MRWKAGECEMDPEGMVKAVKAFAMRGDRQACEEMDSRMEKKVLEMQPREVARMLAGFAQVPGEFASVKAVEKYRKVIVPKMGFEEVAEVLFKCGVERKGSHVLVTEFIGRLKEIVKSDQGITESEVFLTMCIYDLLGVDNEAFALLLDRVESSVQKYHPERLRDIFEILSKRMSDDRFAKCALVYKYELDKYKINSELKA
mmetsp:Transcript_12245/g.13979  ORF Transcript_12245/g.13979 Transcript_12245/m.13979 type:complete len:201 (-) Transcript_12245:41-643(-)